MADWLTHHRESEALAAKAHEHVRFGEQPAAEAAFMQAAEAEEAALALVDRAKPRTLGITAVSAVALFYKARCFDRAMSLAHQYLALPGITDSARAQLDDLLLTLYTERDKARMQGQFLPGSVTVSVKGGEVLRGAAPLDLVVEKVKTLQSMFYRVVEWQWKKPLRRHGGPTKDITNTFQPWLVQEPAGSFQFSVAVKVSGQEDWITPAQMEAADIAKKFLDVVTTLSADTSGDASRALIPEDDYRGTFRKLLRNLTPTGDEFESLIIRSKEREDIDVALDQTTRPKLDLVIRSERPVADAAAGEAPTEFIGVLRGLDLDKDWLKVEIQKGQQVEVKGVSQTVDDVIGPMVNKKVLLTAIKTRSGTLRYVDIQLAP
jgi:hypothetical protein